MFHFSAKSAYKPELFGAFLPCACPAHRGGQIDQCPHLDYVHANVPKVGKAKRTDPEQYLVHRVKRPKISRRGTRAATEETDD